MLILYHHFGNVLQNFDQKISFTQQACYALFQLKNHQITIIYPRSRSC